jgi:hypothetical protein
MSVMHAVTFLNESTASLPFRETLLQGIVCSDLPVSLFVALGPTDLSSLAGSFDTAALLVIVKEDLVAIGPLYEPGKSVCFACLCHWLLTSSAILGLPDMSGSGHEAQVAAELINQALSRVSDSGDDLRNTIQTFDLSQKK